MLVRKAEGGDHHKMLNLNNSEISYCNSLINNSLLLFCSQQHSLCLSFSLSYLKTHTHRHTHTHKHTQLTAIAIAFLPASATSKGVQFTVLHEVLTRQITNTSRYAFEVEREFSHIAVLTASLSWTMKWETVLCQNCPL